MLHLIPFLIALSGVFTNPSTSPIGKPRSIDPAASTVLWTGSKVAGSHTGNIGIRSGSLTFDGDLLLAADVVMDMASITCTDITSPSSNAKLVSHLKGADFFAVEEHPKATFRTRSVERMAGSAGPVTHRITGDLTIKGITHPSSFDAVLVSDASVIKASGTIRFDRTKYSIRYGSGSFVDGLGDRMISDEVVLKFDLVVR